MVVSVSRRCDVPAFEGEWFSHILEAGRVTVRNPRNHRMERSVSLKREDVDAFVFWTRDPMPFLSRLDPLDHAGYPYYFLITVNRYPAVLEPSCPSVQKTRKSLKALRERIGRERIVWRYDPIILSDLTDSAFHRDNFNRLTDILSPFCSRVIISLLDMYPKVERRFRNAAFRPLRMDGAPDVAGELLGHLSTAARNSGLGFQSCAEQLDLGKIAVEKGRCVDERLLNERFGLNLAYRKDRSQRKECLCHESIDIGAYGACRFGCLYCYAR